MNREQIMDVFRALAKSQGFYGRLLRNIEEMKKNKPEDHQKLMEALELMQFKDAVDVVMFFEGA